ncbi:MAG: hypothetical protein MRY79_00165, partial [Alphaproteobacteria bacterium]|nr:hypothetical protein [Alphaproteobacteria bacterium]
KKLNLEKGKGLSIDGLKIGKPDNSKLEQAIIATQRLPLISKHAENIKNEIYLHPSVNWFEKITKITLEETANQHDTLIDRQIIEIIKKLYTKRNIELSQTNENYLLEVLKEFICLINIHMNRLSRRDDIPHTIWTGTGGHMWDIMLRSEVKRRGHTVIAHDHGGGVPHLDHPEKGWVEMWACDEFVTYSEEQVKTFNMFKDTWPNLDKDLPEITSFPSTEEKPDFKTYEKFLNPEPEIKKIRIFSTIYSSEEGRGLPIYPHIPYIDWQARLISHLKESGYEVSFKPHPDSRLSAPKSYKNILDADIIEQSLESMEEDFDLYIFDLSNTSVLQTALFTNKPVLIVDFSVMEWREDAFDLFTKRCGYVKGFYEGSRMCVDWEELTKQVGQAAIKSNNHEFASIYYF